MSNFTFIKVCYIALAYALTLFLGMNSLLKYTWSFSKHSDRQTTMDISYKEFRLFIFTFIKLHQISHAEALTLCLGE
jgi:hypothetical protein